MLTTTDNKKSQMVEALRLTLGNVSEACKAVNISRETHYQWLKNDAEYATEIDNIAESAIDYVESKLFEKITGVSVKKGEDDDGEDIVYNLPPSDTAIIFYLKTRAKKRGYVERNELTGADGNPIAIEQITGMQFK